MSFQLILICMFSLTTNSILPVSGNHNDQRVITIDEAGSSSLECCVYGSCDCSNFSLALEHIQNDTTIRITSDISLLGVPQFESTTDASVTIIGHDNPVIRCDHQGGIVGRNVGYFLIQGVTWDGCDQGVQIDGFLSVHVTDCKFCLSSNFALTLRGHGSVWIKDSMFCNVGNAGVHLYVDSNDASIISSITVYNSTFSNPWYSCYYY